MINYRLIYLSIFFFGLLTILLTIFPSLDIKFTELFYTPVNGFTYKRNLSVEFLYLLIPPLTKIFIVFIIFVIVYQILRYKNFKEVFKSCTIYLLIAAALGPGLVVNYLLKENFYRARPSQIIYFNGSKDFSPAFTISNQCVTNCSFSSGHAAMAYYFTSLAYAAVLLQNTRLSLKQNKLNFSLIYILTLIFGSFVGFSRILMGGHFLSDITTSCVIILLINHLLYECWKKIK